MPCLAQAATPGVPVWLPEARPGELVGLAAFVGLMVFAITVSVLHITARTRWQAEHDRFRQEHEALRARAERGEALLLAEPQIIAVWSRPGEAPALVGSIAGFEPRTLPDGRLALDGLDDPEAALRGIEALRARGESFRRLARTRAGAYLELDGRAMAGRAVLRLREATGDRQEIARLSDRSRVLADELDLTRALLDGAPVPMWQRDASERLAWVNQAYARAVDAASPAEALARGTELLDRAAREESRHLRLGGDAYRRRVPAVVRGARHLLDVTDLAAPNGSAGMAVDISELEAARAALAEQGTAHARTLDQLATAVAIFDADRRLTFYNAAYRALWDLDPAYLDDRPTDGEILDRLRQARRLPEQADFRAWRNGLHEAYRALEAAEHLWLLPGGRTLRVVTTPNPAGGVTYLYEDVTERLDLEARFNALTRVQGETLDALREGVAAFGSDGRLRLYNPAFAAQWKLSPPELDARPHIDALTRTLAVLLRDPAPLAAFRAEVTGLGYDREAGTRRLARVDGSVLDMRTVPLPDGGTLSTFTDVTDTVNFETALVDKNSALEEASRLKNDFVHRVSYELRSPLTNIIGYVQLLAEGAAGPLAAKQREWAGHILTSSDALLVIINNILDLATIDAGAMALELGEVDIRDAMEAAAEGVAHHLVGRGVRLDIDAPPRLGRFRADAKRLRQILFNLLSNAVGFSDEGSTVRLEARREGPSVVFRVVDHGAGIPAAVRERVFGRFESHSGTSDHRGVGLGLSIVRSFVELHGGTVELVSEEGRGTIVTCRLPDEAHVREAAE